MSLCVPVYIIIIKYFAFDKSNHSKKNLWTILVQFTKIQENSVFCGGRKISLRKS